jgi:hypothetical protein
MRYTGQQMGLITMVIFMERYQSGTYVYRTNKPSPTCRAHSIKCRL